MCHFAGVSCIGLIQRGGGNAYGKTFVLDINVVLNNNICLNLEMQVVNPSNWQDRSLSYLGRNFMRAISC